MKYIYTAVFTPNEDGTKIHARIPDLPGCVTTGHDLQDTIDQITDAASGWLVVAEDEELPIPAASKQAEIAHGALDTLSMVCVDTAAYRTQTGTQADLLSALSALSANMSDEDLLYAGIAADIAHAITSKRIDSGLTQKEFADRLGKSQALVSKWENADCNFTLKSLVEIAQKLDMKLDVRLLPNSSAS